MRESGERENGRETRCEVRGKDKAQNAPPGPLDTRVMHVRNSSLDFKPKMKIGLLCDSRRPVFSKHLLRTYYVPGVGDKVMSSICGWGGLRDPGMAHLRGCSHRRDHHPLQVTCDLL